MCLHAYLHISWGEGSSVKNGKTNKTGKNLFDKSVNRKGTRFISLSSLHLSLKAINEGLAAMVQAGTKATFESVISEVISTLNGFNKNLETQWDQMYCILINHLWQPSVFMQIANIWGTRAVILWFYRMKCRQEPEPSQQLNYQKGNTIVAHFLQWIDFWNDLKLFRPLTIIRISIPQSAIPVSNL